ncbi:hypothetical protein NP493_60g01025 [Ridgeia piscesae]|uniref:Uncharacterized protein n=1 Tax=Ridgeia piscesae TaxID=27915 RepID=A0AAD9UJ13_RIDPI|nr:hypothetical protein NP493_60g01025 [Ridgeia piscesae]
MADEENAMVSHPVEENETPSDDEEKKPLEDFVTAEYRKQKEEGQLQPTDQLNEQRIDAFFERAISESRRMSEEVCKSERKMSDLHMELGAETFESWRNEHAAEVLVPVSDHQAEPLF